MFYITAIIADKFIDLETGLEQIKIAMIILSFVGAIIIPVFPMYLWALWVWNNYRYQMKDNVLYIERGVIAKKYVSIPYDRIQNVDIIRGIIDRLLGLSDLQVQTAGASGITLSEGRIRGLEPQLAEEIRDELIRRAKTTRQGI